MIGKGSIYGLYTLDGVQFGKIKGRVKAIKKARITIKKSPRIDRVIVENHDAKRGNYFRWLIDVDGVVKSISGKLV